MPAPLIRTTAKKWCRFGFGVELLQLGKKPARRNARCGLRESCGSDCTSQQLARIRVLAPLGNESTRVGACVMVDAK
jgi:hypothetical protein